MINNRALARLTPVALAALLAACGGPAGTGDTKAPTVHLTSAATTTTADYELTGVVFDNVGVVAASYSLAGADPEALTLSGDEFSVSLTLPAGDSEITVTATDAAGNSGSDSITVTNSGSESEPPGAMTPDTDIAARGDSVTLTGSGFLDSGTVRVGGVEATVSDWSDTEISFTVPMDAPGGPREVVVTTAGGNTSTTLFVGVDFEEGTLEELVALNLPKGTAVRLGAGTFEQSTSELALDNLSLYGQGPGETVVDSGALPQQLALVADTGFDLVIENLTLVTDMMIVTSTPPGPVDAAALTGTDLPALIADVASNSPSLGSMSAAGGSLTLRDLVIDEHLGGLGFLTVDLSAAIPYRGSVSVSNVTHDASGSAFAVMSGGSVTVSDSDFDNAGHIFASLLGDVSVTGVTAESGVGSLGAGLLASGDLTVSDSSFEAYLGGAYQLGSVGFLTGATAAIIGGAGNVVITDSSFRVRASDPLADPVAGSLVMGFAGADNVVRGNTFVVSRDLDLQTAAGHLDFDGNEVTLGHPDIASSAFRVSQLDELPSYVDVRNNQINWTNGGSTVINRPAGQTIRRNTFSGIGSAALVIDEDGSDNSPDVQVLSNAFTGFENAMTMVLGGAGDEPANFVINGNVFDFPIDAVGKVAVLGDVVNATIDADGNRWGEEDDIATLNSYIVRSGATPADMMEIGSVMP